MPDMCPSAETILAAVEHPGEGCSDPANVVQHLLRCRECRAVLTFVCTAVAFELDRKRQQALWRRCRAKIHDGFVPRSDCTDGECFDAIAAETPAVLILQSSVEKRDVHFWRATMTFPDVDWTEAPLAIRVEGANGTPIQNGIFVLFGIEIPIVKGAGQLSRAQLAECHHKGGAVFKWQDGVAVSGAPVLNT